MYNRKHQFPEPLPDDAHDMGHLGTGNNEAKIDGLVQGCGNSSALAMELLQPGTKPAK